MRSRVTLLLIAILHQISTVCHKCRATLWRRLFGAWCIQTFILVLIWKWMLASFERSDLVPTPLLGQRENPLLDTSGLPRFAHISAADVLPGITKAAAELERSLQLFEHTLETTKNTPRTWASVEEPLEILRRPIDYSWRVASHLQSVKSSPELRAAVQQAQPILLDISSMLEQSVSIYNAFKDLSLNKKLDGTQHRIIESNLYSMKNSGVDLEAEKRHRFNEINQLLANLTMRFRNNVLDATSGFSILLTDKSSVEGLPETSRKLLASAAVAGTGKSPDPENGPWKVGLDLPSYEPVMVYSSNRKLREQLYRARAGRACSGQHDNIAVIEEIRKLRQEKARMLGYKNYAEFSLNAKMAKTVYAVWGMLDSLHNKTYPVALKEVELLTDFASHSGHQGKLEKWDTAYWTEKHMKMLFSISDEEFRPYFPLGRYVFFIMFQCSVLAGLFNLSWDLFGVKIRPADGAAEVWDQSVRFFNVYNEKEIHIASFFLDPYSRPNEKQAGAWMDNFLSRSSLLHQLPVAFVILNQIPPIGSTPSLMSFYEVRTLFHEFGHTLQHMLSTVPYEGASGINNIEWDAVEFSSQFMSNWVYDRRTIDAISGHYQTGEPLPQAMFEKKMKARYYMKGIDMLTQLHLAALDLTLHSSTDPLEILKKKVSDKFTVTKPIKGDCFPSTFLHIFGGDSYAASYYSYKWAEVLAQDAFAAFEEVGLQNKEKIRKVGRRFRDTVLSLGGGTPPLQVFRMFRGRSPSYTALLKGYGLA
ncbi:probable cytosolic oligopeptidase A [Polyodon spathula]|uniref:probable cytosolic oligopeptidase A n=1 Tax=Polyodon spathula TaxID=7913 RepID=UPI001B7F0501|nr:probable cytosolic oligopeptidase A [Polyodon spathula]